ncbi:MAG: hypothetical protein Q9222_002319 [Ikaeria aurantiellina]
MGAAPPAATMVGIFMELPRWTLDVMRDGRTLEQDTGPPKCRKDLLPIPASDPITMDTSSSLSQPNLDISKLSDYDKRDLQQQIGNEMQKAKIQECPSSLSSLSYSSLFPLRTTSIVTNFTPIIPSFQHTSANVYA